MKKSEWLLLHNESLNCDHIKRLADFHLYSLCFIHRPAVLYFDNLIDNHGLLSCTGKIKNLCWLIKYVACAHWTSTNTPLGAQLSNVYDCGICLKYLYTPHICWHSQCPQAVLMQRCSRLVHSSRKGTYKHIYIHYIIVSQVTPDKVSSEPWTTTI